MFHLGSTSFRACTSLQLCVLSQRASFGYTMQVWNVIDPVSASFESNPDFDESNHYSCLVITFARQECRATVSVSGTSLSLWLPVFTLEDIFRHPCNHERMMLQPCCVASGTSGLERCASTLYSHGITNYRNFHQVKSPWKLHNLLWWVNFITLQTELCVR